MHVRKSEYPLCRHTKANGLQCQSPALSTSAFCHHHQKARRNSSASAGPGLSTHVLHPLRNAHSIQQALAMVVSGLAANRIHHKAAGKMLYAIQLAATNLSKGPLQ